MLPTAGPPPSSHFETDKGPAKKEQDHVREFGERYQDQDGFCGD